MWPFAAMSDAKNVPPATQSPAQLEKDAAVAIARRVLNSGGAVGVTESHILARQLLRALALPA